MHISVCSSVVEHVTDNDGVPGSIPGTRTTNHSLKLKYMAQPYESLAYSSSCSVPEGWKSEWFTAGAATKR